MTRVAVDDLRRQGSGRLKTTDPRVAAGRAFVRSLNILLKFARLYGFGHARTGKQVQIAWEELRAAIPEGNETGLLLGATGSQLLLDGVPLEATPAEKQFAQLLSMAGLASIQFYPCITEDELASFALAFPTGKAKPAELAEQLKVALTDARGIRVNEICFVATDSRLKDTSMAAQLAVAALSDEQDQFRKMLNDPQKLLELIAAAEGRKFGGGTSGVTSDGTGSETNGHGTGNSTGVVPSGNDSGLIEHMRRVTDRGPLSEAGRGKGIGSNGSSASGEEDIRGILGLLSMVGKTGRLQNPTAATAEFQNQVTQLPARAQDTLQGALAELAERGKNKKLDQAVLVQLAEHLSIRFALEKFERGDVKVSAVRQMLDRLNHEIEELRNILGQHEDKMTDAGIAVESHREILDRRFWANVPDRAKREVLLSEEAWCIPPKNVQSYVAELIEQGDIAGATSILQNYARGVNSEDPDARKRAATGLSELAAQYAQTDPRLLVDALRHVGLRLSVEQDQDLQSLASAAFVRLSQEAASHRSFPAMGQALDALASVESQRPGTARLLEPKMGIKERVPEFVDEALRTRQIPVGLIGVLKQLPQTAMEQLAGKFNRCEYREDLENVANLAQDLGEEAQHYLRSTVRGGHQAEAVEMVGMLARLDPQAAQRFLPGRIKDFPRAGQDRIVRLISASGAPERCRILLNVLDHVDPLLMPLVVDEIGVTRDREALGRLLTLVDGDLPAGGGQFLRVKAIEALVRLQAPGSVGAMKRILESRKLFGWAHAQELRIAALQVLEKLEPEWVKDYLPGSGIEPDDVALAPLDVARETKFVRWRRHRRVWLQKAVPAVSTNLKQNCRLEIKSASLTGGLATVDMHFAPGTTVELRMQVGLRNIQATALMRECRGQHSAFEIVDMGLEERTKLRKLLLENMGKSRDAGAPRDNGVYQRRS
jgi:hypothetical protein